MKSMLSKAAWLRVIPFVLFMVMLAIRGNWPAGAQAVLDAKWVYGLGVLLVGGALYVLWPQYQELARDQRKLGWLGWLLSITVGVVVFVLWINLTEPWMIIGTPTASFQPVDDEGQLMWSLVLMRWVGAALMVPVMEYMARSHPRLKLTLTRGPIKAQLEQLRQREVDAVAASFATAGEVVAAINAPNVNIEPGTVLVLPPVEVRL